MAQLDLAIYWIHLRLFNVCGPVSILVRIMPRRAIWKDSDSDEPSRQRQCRWVDSDSPSEDEGEDEGNAGVFDDANADGSDIDFSALVDSTDDEDEAQLLEPDVEDQLREPRGEVKDPDKCSQGCTWKGSLIDGKRDAGGRFKEPLRGSCVDAGMEEKNLFNTQHFVTREIIKCIEEKFVIDRYLFDNIMCYVFRAQDGRGALRGREGDMLQGSGSRRGRLATFPLW